MSEKSTI